MSTAVAVERERVALQCMEIWGGNEAVENAISVTGIDAWVCSRPEGGSSAGGDVHYVSLCGGGTPALDDATVLVLHHNASAPKGWSAGEAVRVVGKMLGILRV